MDKKANIYDLSLLAAEILAIKIPTLYCLNFDRYSNLEFSTFKFEVNNERVKAFHGELNDGRYLSCYCQDSEIYLGLEESELRAVLNRKLQAYLFPFFSFDKIKELFKWKLPEYLEIT